MGRENTDINLDTMASAPLEAGVRRFLAEAWSRDWAQPDGRHRAARTSQLALTEAREKVLRALKARDHRLIFTSGATESNAMALLGKPWQSLARFKNFPTVHLISSQWEHASIKRTLRALTEQGNTCSLLLGQVPATAQVALDEVMRIKKVNTALVSIQWVNQEVGSVQNLAKIAAFCRRSNILLHVDASQALGKIDIDLLEIPIDLLTLSGHKAGAPAGVGALLLRKDLSLHALFGRTDEEDLYLRPEWSMRPGTFSVVLAQAFALAVESANRSDLLAERWGAVSHLRKLFLQHLTVDFEINAEGDLPHCLNLWFKNCPGEDIILSCPHLSLAQGSACAQGRPSETLMAWGYSAQRIHESLRISLHYSLSTADVIKAAQDISSAVQEIKGLTETVRMVRNANAYRDFPSNAEDLQGQPG